MVSDRLSTRIVYVAIPAAILLIGAGAAGAIWQTGDMLSRGIQTQLTTSVRLMAADVTAFLDRAEEELSLIATAPGVVAAADAAGQDAARRGLPAIPTESLEDRFAEDRSVGRSAAIDAYLQAARASSPFTDLQLTERHGFVVSSVEETPDFVQADEGWWQSTWESGRFLGEPQYDEAVRAVALDLAVQVRAPGRDQPVGVLRGPVRLAQLAARLQAAANSAALVEVVDSTGRVLVARDSTRLLRPSAFAGALTRSRDVVTRRVTTTEAEWILIMAPTAHGRWWVTIREPTSSAFATARAIRLMIGIAAGGVLLVIVAVLWTAANWMESRITVPLQHSSRVASQVAAGDLSTDVTALQRAAPEVQAMLVSLRQMIVELRSVVTGIRSAAEELAAMAQQISASTEEMSASTEEMASTSQRLSDQSGRQADQVHGASADADRILAIATQLADGAAMAATRSGDLQQAAEAHRSHLLAGSERLAALAEEVQRSARDAETMAGLSAEVQQFVTQAKTIATRTNMLALNAAIEAARAGTEGQGFAVVADEVRKLATQAAQSAQSTSETVARVLQGVEGTRERLRHLAEESAAVREIADAAARGLADITDQAVENKGWADEIAQAAKDSQRLVADITGQLRAVAEGTESAVAAIEEIAAAAEEQSASTQEIAASASHLAEASERLNAGVSQFRLADTRSADAGD